MAQYSYSFKPQFFFFFLPNTKTGQNKRFVIFDNLGRSYDTENSATYKTGMKCVEKWLDGWKLELAINIRNEEQLSKVRLGPKSHSGQLAQDRKKPAQLIKRRSISEYYFTAEQWHGLVPRGDPSSSDYSLEQQPSPFNGAPGSIQAMEGHSWGSAISPQGSRVSHT